MGAQMGGWKFSTFNWYIIYFKEKETQYSWYYFVWFHFNVFYLQVERMKHLKKKASKSYQLFFISGLTTARDDGH